MSLRPGVRDFLEKAAQHFELIIFTAAAQMYADPIIDALDYEKRLFSRRLYRHNCTRHLLSDGSEIYVKELRCIADRKFNSSILVDDNWIHIKANMGRVRWVSPFLDATQENDRELEQVLCELLHEETWL